MKSLKAIQTLSKIGRVLSIIARVCCIIGGVCCAVTAGLLAVYGEKAISITKDNMDKIDDEQARQIIQQLTTPMMVTVIAIGAVFCFAGAVVARFAQNYFKHEIEDGTPFTVRGAKELMRLGIIYIAVNLGASIVAGTVFAIVSKSLEDADKLLLSPRPLLSPRSLLSLRPLLLPRLLLSPRSLPKRHPWKLPQRCNPCRLTFIVNSVKKYLSPAVGCQRPDSRGFF